MMYNDCGMGFGVHGYEHALFILIYLIVLKFHFQILVILCYYILDYYYLLAIAIFFILTSYYCPVLLYQVFIPKRCTCAGHLCQIFHYDL
jgi:hypothetical protein